MGKPFIELLDKFNARYKAAPTSTFAGHLTLIFWHNANQPPAGGEKEIAKMSEDELFAYLDTQILQ